MELDRIEKHCASQPAQGLNMLVPTFQIFHLRKCSVVSYSFFYKLSLTVNCLTCMSIVSNHCGDDHELFQPELVIIPCCARFCTFEPLPEYRSVCPYALVVASGAHSHPIPLPIKHHQLSEMKYLILRV